MVTNVSDDLWTLGNFSFNKKRQIWKISNIINQSERIKDMIIYIESKPKWCIPICWFICHYVNFTCANKSQKSLKSPNAYQINRLMWFVNKVFRLRWYETCSAFYYYNYSISSTFACLYFYPYRFMFILFIACVDCMSQN